MTRRLKQYVVSVRDPDGATKKYVCWDTSRRRAKAEAAHCWGDRFVECRPALERKSGRRLLSVAGATFAIAGAIIAATMAVALHV
jgi:hypothetical protein